MIFVVKELQLFLSTNFSSSGSLVSFHLDDDITFAWVFFNAQFREIEVKELACFFISKVHFSKFNLLLICLTRVDTTTM